MKRTLIIPLVGLLLLSVACRLTPGLATEPTPTEPPTPQPVPVTPTSALVLPTTTAAVELSPTETSLPPTATAAPTEAPTPLPTIPPTAAPTATSPAPAAAPTVGPLAFTETYDQANEYWSGPLVVTSQAAGHEPFVKFSMEGGRLKVGIQDKETYVYQFFKPPLTDQTSIAVTYEYRTLADNGVSVVCNADPGMTAWYEVRLLAGESKYNLYLYTKRGVEDAKNPYTLLAQGILTAKEYSSVKGNLVTLTCSDSEIKVDLNDGAKGFTQHVDSPLQGNQVGIGVMSFNSLPVNIDFKTVEIHSR